MDNFDKRFKRTNRTINAGFIVVIVLIIAILIGGTVAGIYLIRGAIQVGNRIQQDGLKSIVEDVWEGSGQKSTEAPLKE